jgi:hypothetical protein
MGVGRIVCGLFKGARRRPITSKEGNKNFYKGKGSGKMGYWNKDGKYVVEQWRTRQFIVPDLSDFKVLFTNKLTPFVTPSADDRVKFKHSCLDYFSPEHKVLSDELNEKCLKLLK